MLPFRMGACQAPLELKHLREFQSDTEVEE